MAGPMIHLKKCLKNFTIPMFNLFLQYRRCLFERVQMIDYDQRCLHLSILGCYQSYLGRDTQIEEDLDDGTFTGRHIQEQIGDIMRAEIVREKKRKKKKKKKIFDSNSYVINFSFFYFFFFLFIFFSSFFFPVLIHR